ncbi:DUF6207 family protein [Streptomyces rishiriensis]|uniref:DUF6207 family protein n=1 Tax=Streptomyces rishiriensis TaxID=68264 RepID=UPI0037CD2FA9
MIRHAFVGEVCEAGGASVVEAHSAELKNLHEPVSASAELSFQQLLAERWATATAETTTGDAGEPGVRLRCYLDRRQQLTAAAVAGPTM